MKTKLLDALQKKVDKMPDSPLKTEMLEDIKKRKETKLVTK